MQRDIKRTPLAEEHERLGAKMIEFAGYYMPVSYSSILDEHEAVRKRLGIFDVSHMGEFIVEGQGALDFVDRLVTNDCSRLEPGAILYTVMCREDGTTIDDLLVYNLTQDDNPKFMLVVNAANIEKDFAHISENVPPGVDLQDISGDCALIAVQGPLSKEVLLDCPLFSGVKDTIDALPFYHCLSFPSGGDEILVSRTGYTGELGYEILVPPSRAAEFWREVLLRGKDKGIMPSGLAARDTLRFEASFCLYGHELDDETTPLEAGLNWVVKFVKPEFIGKEALLKARGQGLRKRLVGFELEGRNIARQGFEVLKDDRPVGVVTSGNYSPTLKKSLCMAFVKDDSENLDGDFAVAVRNKLIPARIRNLPFYRSRAKE